MKKILIFLVFSSMVPLAIAQSSDVVVTIDQNQVPHTFENPLNTFVLDCSPPSSATLNISYTYYYAGLQNKARYKLYREVAGIWLKIHEWTHYRDPYGPDSATTTTTYNLGLLAYPGINNFKVTAALDNGTIGGSVINSCCFDAYTFRINMPESPTQVNLNDGTLVNNQYYEVCGSNIVFSYNNCLFLHKYTIERVDQNFASLTPAEVTNTSSFFGIPQVFPGTPPPVVNANFTIPSSEYVFQTGEYYKIKVTLGATLLEQTFLVHCKQQQTIQVSPTVVEVCQGQSPVSLNASLSGYTGSFSWSPATNLSASTGTSVNFNPQVAGSSTITVSPNSSVNCVTDAEVDVTVFPKPSLSSSSVFFCEEELPYDFNSDVQVSPSGIPGDILWPSTCGWNTNGTYDFINAGCDVISAVTQRSPSEGIQYVTLDGCTSDVHLLQYTWNESPVANETVTDISCSNTADGEIALNPDVANAPYTVDWSTGATANTISNLSAGVYTVTVTDADGCDASASISVNSPTPLTITAPSVTDAPCSSSSFTNQYGSVDFAWGGGTPPYQISLDGGSFFNTNGATTHTGVALIAGDHTFAIQDANGCITPIGEPYLFNVGAVTNFEFTSGFPVANDAQCVGLNNGSIDVSVDVSGGTTPYSIVYERGGTATAPSGTTTHTFNGLAPGSNHVISVTEQTNGCQLVAGPIAIGNQNPGLFSASISSVAPSCAGVGDGSLTGSVSGSISSPSYSWSTGATGPTVNNLFNGTYSVTVTETAAPNAGCKATASTTFDITPDAWHQHSDGHNTEQGRKVITDASGNVYVLGTFFKETVLEETGIDYNASSTGYFVVKYNECGEVLWVAYPQLVSGSATDFEAIDLVLDGGMLYVFLHTATTDYGDIDLLVDPSSGSGTISGPGGTSYTVVLELDPSDGGFSGAEFIEELDYTLDDRYKDVEASGGDFYLAGRKDNKAQIHQYQFGSSISVEVENSAAGVNTFEDIEYDGQSHWYGVGTTTGNLDFGSSVTLSAGSLNQGFVLRMSGSFSPEQVERTCSAGCTAVALEVTTSGNNPAVWVAGKTEGAIHDNMYIRGLSSGFITQWTSSFDDGASSISDAQAVDIVMDENNNLIATGSFVGTTAHITSNGSGAQVNGDNMNNDIWLGSFLSSTGQCEWLLSAKSQGAATPTALGTNGSGNNYVVGGYVEDVDFYLSQEPQLAHLNPGNEAMFAIRFGTITPNGMQADFYKHGNSGTSGSESSVGEELLAGEIAFDLYPNPVRDRFTLTWTPAEGIAKMQVFDMRGTLVQVRSLDANQGIEEWDVSNLPAGTYIVAVQLNGEVWRERMVKY